MSVFRWRYTEECEGRYCCGDCDKCDKEDEPVDDLISRQAAIDAMYEGMPGLTFNEALKRLRELPTAEKKGKWIDDNCSVCGQYVYHGDARNYCPNCGCRMMEDDMR